MRVRLARAVVVALVAVLILGCSGQVRASAPQASPDPSCPSSGAPSSEGCWQSILPMGNGGFPADPGSQNTPLWEPGRFPLTLTPHAAYDDALWMTAQTSAYSSPDGLTWTEHVKTDWGERIYESIVYFEDRLWMYGGFDYQARTFLNDIWSSSDGVTWSNDGVAWNPVTHAAHWSPRDEAGVVVFNDQLYLLGGQGMADVWRSSSGREWTRLVAEADWSPRHDFARLAFDGRLWVFGGWTDRSTNALNDVWYSADGTNWSRQTDHAPWAPRSPITVVFQDKILIYSGKHTGSDDNWGGDVWQMTTGAVSTG
jgi:hypothetical protein